MKYLSLLVAIISFISISTFASMQSVKINQIQKRLEKLEKNFNGKIGVYAVDTNNNQVIAYRANERFPMQSTFKLIGVSALLKESTNKRYLLKKKIFYTKKDLVAWHPITGSHVESGMTLEALSAAAISYSDNTAINLIINYLGGLKFIINFSRDIGNKTFTIEHYEPNLNSNPQNKDDTSTPKDIAISLQKLTLGNVLARPEQVKLITWMRNNTSGDKRIRAAVPVGWVVADKTGTGSYGVANDIGIIWPPECKPIVLAIYTARNRRGAKTRDDIVASTTSIILTTFAKNDYCVTVN